MVLPFRGLQQMPRTLMGRGAAVFTGSGSAAMAVPAPSRAAVPCFREIDDESLSMAWLKDP